ncbi:aldehyde oxidase-like isoform X1 [Pelobates cultripes]|uniref:aldehyde oxidase n=1 Tax=Pelobates cultripes TaxID=61616 RepID=A0AAD1WHA1_PELCU|nr:aldehyde oxidase-like isoform X1 [Pelobates cultripes]
MYKSQIIEQRIDPETMLLPYLRKQHILSCTKYGCGEGGCGSCTVMISTIHPISKKIIHFSANACLLPVCSLHGTAVTTVEGIGSTTTRLHPVQERIAKAHGSQCGFCSPGIVMSIYALLRNHPEPTMDQIYEALGGNLCRCTGYRPIVESCKTFCKEVNCCQRQEKCNGPIKNGPVENQISTLFNKEEFLPLDPSQELIFPPELTLMAGKNKPQTMVFQGEKIKWIAPITLEELLELKAQYPKAPIVVGNTSIGIQMKQIGVCYPVFIYVGRIADLFLVKYTNEGISVGAACTLSMLNEILYDAVSQLPEEKTKIFRVLLQQLKTLAGQQIRNVASLGGHIISRNANSDLNPVLAAGNASLYLMSKGGSRHIPCNDSYFQSTEKLPVLFPGEVLVSVLIPYSQKWEIVSAFRQSQTKMNSAAIVVSAMRVLFQENTDLIKDCNIFFGGIGESTVCAKKTRQGLIGRHWDEEMLSDACRLVLDEVSLSPAAPGGKVEYKRTLTISFFFKFYLKVLRELPSVNCHSPLEISGDGGVTNSHIAKPSAKQRYQNVKLNQPLQDTIGRPVMHHSAMLQVSGEAVYCDDMAAVEGELFMALLTSPRAHAKILSIDLTEALNMPGVCDVVTAKDIPDTNEFRFIDWDDCLFADEKVLCVGDIVCAVLADTPAHAKQAVNKVNIVYENIEPAIITIEDAIRHNSFHTPDKKIQQGNVDEAFKKVDNIHEGEIHIGGQEHFYMETQSVRVIPSKDNKEMDIYAASQDPSFMQGLVASTLGIPSNRIHCHVKRIGGAFGGKIVKTAHLAAITAVAARKTKQAVRCILERGEDMLIKGGRHPYIGKYKVGYMNDGRIMAADINLYSNGGCFTTESICIMELAVLQNTHAYNIPNLKCHGMVCKTNLPSNIAFRGFGFPQSALITEAWIEEIAAKCNLPPHKIREINMYGNVAMTPYKQEFDTCNLRRCWEECMESSQYHDRKEKVTWFNKQNQWTKKGISIIPLNFPISYILSYQNQAAALVHIYVDGSVLVSHGGTEMGQGIHTKIIQIASRELQIPISYIHICETSTATVPNTLATAATIGTDVNGLAVKNACEKLRGRLEPIVKGNPTGTWENWVKEAFIQKISLSATGYSRGYDTYIDWEKGEGRPFQYCVYGAACSEVEIDCLTGDHKNIRTDVVMDVGCSINPALDVGQIEGAFVQGIGLFTTEELKYSPEGVLHTRGPGQYKIPTVCDIPQEFNVSLLSSSQNPYAIYSSKGIGEPALFLGSSVYFAIKDAIVSARKERGMSDIFTLNSPATPEKIRMACADQFTKMIPKDNPKSFIPWAIDI